MIIKQNFDETKANFSSWWSGKDIGRPLVKIIGYGEGDENIKIPADFCEFHMDADYRFDLSKKYNSNREFYGEAFPYIDLNMGPGSMAAYLGAKPIFEPATVWYKAAVKNSLTELGKLSITKENPWWIKHVEQVQKLSGLLKNTETWPTIPDILENIDILALLQSPQDLCYELIDNPELVHDYIKQIDDLYFQCYEEFYNLVRDDTGACCFTAFSIWAPSKCAKLQCDFSSLMSPNQFNEFIFNSLKKQCEKIDYTLYHLDGPDAIRHLDSIMKLDKLNALQWTPGARENDGGSEKWYSIYDKVRESGKSLWISLDQGDVDCLIEKSKKLVNRYGSSGLYFIYSELPLQDAQKLYDAAKRNFNNK